MLSTPALVRRSNAATSNLLAEKNRLQEAYLDRPTDERKATFYQCCRLAQQGLREIHDAWKPCKAEEIQDSTERNEAKNFIAAIRAVYGPPTERTTLLLSFHRSTLLTEKSLILKRWAEHFRNVINCSPPKNADAAIDAPPPTTQSRNRRRPGPRALPSRNHSSLKERHQAATQSWLNSTSTTATS
ncbi:hypothetical protein SprV_0501808500 [Sparganum proliferum]